MGTPTRFPGGIGTDSPIANLGYFGEPNPTKWATFFDDLFAPAAALGTFVAVAGSGGLVTIATLNQIATPVASFLPTATKGLLYKAKFSTDTVATGSVSAGVTDVLATPTKGITVTLLNGLFTLTNRYAGTTDTATVVYTANQQVTIGFAYVPGDGITGFFNDLAVAKLPLPTFDATNLRAGIYSSGSTLTVDYVFASLER